MFPDLPVPDGRDKLDKILDGEWEAPATTRPNELAWTIFAAVLWANLATAAIGALVWMVVYGVTS